MSATQKTTLNLFNISNLLEENKIKLCICWIEVSTVKAVFDARNISALKFRNAYAIPILEYFIAVSRREKSLGDCPTMSKLVHFLLSKNITPREIFDICSGLKGVILSFLLAQKIVLKNPILFVEEVTTIFDTNFSGVLEIFTNIYDVAQKKLLNAKLQGVKLQQTLKIINHINTKIIIIHKAKIILANEPFFRMLGVKNLKELELIHKSELDFLNNITLYKNYFNSNKLAWIEKVYKENKPFQCEIFNEEIKKSFYYSARITYMPESSYGEYIITFNNISEHIKDEKELHYLLFHDELTGLMNYPAFEKLLSKKIEVVKKMNERLFLVIIDIPDLKVINAQEGVEKGDIIICEVRDDLKLLANENIYLGRLDEDRFGALLHYKDEKEAYNWSVLLYKKMKEHPFRKTVSLSEVDLSETINKLFLRVYDLVEQSNRSEDEILVNDFKHILKYTDLPDQSNYIQKLLLYKSINISLFYMELVVAFNAEVVSSIDESIVVKLSTKQISIAYIDMPLYFQLNNIGNIKAYIQEIDKKKKTVLIHRFRSDRHSPLNRKIFRIKVLDTVKAYIEESNRDYDVQLLDMNYESVAIEIDRKRNFDLNSIVSIDMLLPTDSALKSVLFTAKIIRVEKSRQGYKMVLSFQENAENQKFLNSISQNVK